MTSTDNNQHQEQEQELSAAQRHDRAVIRMLTSHGCEISMLLGPTDHLDPDLYYDICAALQNIEFSHLHIGSDTNTVAFRQRCLGHCGELDQLLTAAGYDSLTRRQVEAVLDAQAHDAEYFRRTAIATGLTDSGTADRC
ncbi:hypothetical protein IU449_27580 [Nocardia higoensis]|uniref:Uncharacterized protein n=1 Tax=Nocardia higoensis TaxID=228599 RepID=A0ABS0DK28_9NOCA|nr:hypothetical protein [Nocardia higoensis]MBF6358263.1 hypothetical protein [Nocardia higoensis]